MTDLIVIRATCPKDGWTLTLPLNRDEVIQAILYGKCMACRGPVAIEHACLTATPATPKES